MPSTTIKYFAFAHLPPKLQAVSKPLGELAEKLESMLPDGPEKSAGMRKLLEAKDCFVRCAIDMPETTQDKLLAHASGTAEGFTVPVEVPPHQARVIKEKAARDGEISSLAAFITGNAVFATLPAEEQARLRRQLDVMRELSVILGERIAAFSADASDDFPLGKACDLSGDGTCEACQ